MADTPENPQLPDNPRIPGDIGKPAPGASQPPVRSPGTPAIPPSPSELAGRSGIPLPGTAHSGDTPRRYSPPPNRTSSQIRADMEAQRHELGKSVEHLRDRVTELTDWRGQIRKHRKQIVIGAVATGFVVGGLMALRR